LVADRPDVAGEVVLAQQTEMAVTVEDILQRRTNLGLVAPAETKALAHRASAILSDNLDMNDDSDEDVSATK